MDIEAIGYLAAVLTTASFVPQAVKTLRSRDTRGISAWMYAMFCSGVALWFAYGVLIGAWPVIIANALTFVLAASILGMKLGMGRAAGEGSSGS